MGDSIVFFPPIFNHFQMQNALNIRLAHQGDHIYAEKISSMYEDSSKERGTGIAIRQPEYIKKKISEEKAVIAFVDDQLAGFCYIETFSEGLYVSNSGLIVTSMFRGLGLGKKIKEVIFNMAREKYPNAKVFGITTSSAVMKINSDLGYRPVSFQDLTDDEEFWKGCSSCPNYDILLRNSKKLCLCTGMLAPSKKDIMRTDDENLVTEIKNEV